jgi:colanic acid biosynthesis glycosyl transferase WcaI
MKNVKLSETAHPSKLFEFLACGKPVVCCARGELTKLIKEGDCGLSVEPQNPSALVEALQSLYLDEGERIAMGARGRQFVIDKFSYSIVGQKMQHTFEEVQLQKTEQ